MKKLHKILLGTVLGLVGTGLALVALLMLSFNTLGRTWVTGNLVPQVEQELSRTLQHPVHLGPIESLSPWQVVVGHSTVAGFGEVAQIGVDLNPWELLTQKPIPLGLSLREPDLTLRQDNRGRWEIAQLLAQPPGGAPTVLIRHVNIQNGKIRIRSALAPAFELAGVNGTSDANLTRTNLSLQGQLAQGTWKVQGGFDPGGKGSLNVQLEQIQTGAPLALIGLREAFKLDAQATGAVVLQWAGHPIPRWDGQLRLQQGTARLQSLLHPITDIAGLIIFQGQDLTSTHLQGQFGELSLTAQGKLQGLKQLDLALQGQKLTLPGLQQTFQIQLPVPVQGAVQASAGLTGPLNNLTLAAVFKEVTPGQVDRLPLDHYQGKVNLNTRSGHLNFTNLRLSALQGTILGQGEVDLYQQQLHFNGQGQNLNGDRIWRAYNGSAEQHFGALGADFVVAGPTNHLTTTVNWNLQGGDWPGTGRLVAEGARYDLQDVRLQKAGGQLAVQANMVNNRWTAQIQPLGVRLEQLLPGVQAGGIPIQGNLGGEIQAQGQWGQFRLSQIRGKGTVFLPQGIGLISEPLRSPWVWDGQQVHLARGAATGFQATGTLAVTDSLQVPQWDLVVHTERFPLSRLTNLNLPKQVQIVGLANFTGQLGGSPSAPTFSGNGRVQDLQVAGVQFPLLQGTLDYNPARLITRLQGQASQVALRVNGEGLQQLTLQRGVTRITGVRSGTTLVGKVVELPLTTLLPSLKLDFPLGWISGGLAGDYRLSLVGPPRFQGQLALQRGRWGGIPLNQVQLDLAYLGTRWQLNRGEVLFPIPAGGASRFDLSGFWDTQSDAVGGTLITRNGTLDGLAVALGWRSWNDIPRTWAEGLTPKNLGRAPDLGRVQRRVIGTLAQRLEAFARFIDTYQRPQTPVPPSGFFQGEVKVVGTLHEPQFNFKLSGQEWRLGAFRFSSLQAQGNYQRQTLSLDPLQLNFAGLRQGTLAFQGTIGPQSQQGTLAIRNFAAGVSQYFLPSNFQLRGDLDLDATISGTRVNPLLGGTFQIRNGSLNRAKLRQAEGGIGYREGRLSLRDTLVAIGTEPARINGSFPLPAFGAIPTDNRVRMQLQVKNEALGLMNLFTDQVQWQGGQGNLDLQIGGTTQALDLQGTLAVQKAKVSLTGFAQPLTDLTTQVTFLRDRAQVDHLSAQLGGGKVTAQPGLLALTLAVADSIPPLLIDLDNLTLQIPQLYEGEAQGRLQWGGSVLTPAFGGRVTLQNGRFSLPDTTKKTTTTVNASLSEEAASIRRINTPRLRNLEVYLGERVTLTQSPVLRVDPQGTLVFNGTFDRPEPRGEVRFVRGRLNLFPVPFYLDNSQTSVARFRPELGLNPELDILAYARATEVNTAGSGFLPTNTLKSNSSNPFINEQIVRITARVTGRASKPEIELRSSPPRSRDEIIALLGGSNPILGTGVAFVGSPILTPLEDFFLENLGLDIFTISPTTRTLPSSPGAIALGLGLEVGKDINRDFSLSISQSLTDPSQQTRLSVRYRLSDEVQLRLSTDFKRDVSFSIEYDTRF